MEATNLQNMSTISDLQRELKQWRERAREMERELETLSQTNSKLSDQSSEAKILREKIELLFKEREAREREIEMKIATIVESNERAAEKLRLDYQIEKEDLVGKYESRLNTEKALYEEQVLGLKRDLVRDHNDELSKIIAERSQFKSQLESLKTESQARQRQSELDIETLKQTLAKTQVELSEKSSIFETLRGEHTRATDELMSARQTTTRQATTIDQLNAEIVQLKELFECKSSDSKRELKVQLELANQQLENKWKEVLR